MFELYYGNRGELPRTVANAARLFDRIRFLQPNRPAKSDREIPVDHRSPCEASACRSEMASPRLPFRLDQSLP